MFVAFMPLHISFCDDVCPICFILHIGVIQNLKLNFIKKEFEKIKGFIRRIFSYTYFILGRNLVADLTSQTVLFPCVQPSCRPSWPSSNLSLLCECAARPDHHATRADPATPVLPCPALPDSASCSPWTPHLVRQTE
jgi:hypothetical protein